MATWWSVEFTGEPTDLDREHVAEMIIEGFTSRQLVNDPSEPLPVGTRVRNIHTGTAGTVTRRIDLGYTRVEWDNGRTYSINDDSIEVIGEPADPAIALNAALDAVGDEIRAIGHRTAWGSGQI